MHQLIMRFGPSMALLFAGVSANAALVLDGSFENQAVLQGNPSYTPTSGAFSGQPLGAGWNNWGWSSWQGNIPGVGVWVGGAIARTEEFGAGWKWAHDGGVFGIIKDRQTMSQTFVATEGGVGTLDWFDANRPSWRGHTWFGRPNDYSVTLTDSNGGVQTVGNYTSAVYLGLESNSWNDWGDDRFTSAGKAGWFPKTATGFVLQGGMTYTLAFNSLAPTYVDRNGITQIDDRTTLLDSISLSVSPMLDPDLVPEAGTAGALGMVALVGLSGWCRARRR
jgi:hypothetical protein